MGPSDKFARGALVFDRRRPGASSPRRPSRNSVDMAEINRHFFLSRSWRRLGGKRSGAAVSKWYRGVL